MLRAPAPGQTIGGVTPIIICPIPAGPMPDGDTVRPPEFYRSPPDHLFAHSSVHLQGNPQTEKIGASAFYFPADGNMVDPRHLHTRVVVDNPSPTDTLAFIID